jgi:hypothetical protein
VLNSQDAEALFFGHRLHGRTLNSGLEHGASIAPDGTAVMFGDWGVGAGNAEYIDGRMCFVLPTTRLCALVLRNPGGTRAKENEFIWFGFWTVPFSQVD